MLYRFLKFVLGYTVRLYFREIEFKNTDRIPLKGPVIFLPNHRSAFMDPIVVAAFIKRRVHFLARGESFKNPIVAKILGLLNVIPIFRREHSPDDMFKNEEIFRYCHQLLEQNGALVIFPEGASQSKPILLPLKTGAARIALGAEEKNQFKLGVQLVPVGINYTNPHHFQGKLLLNFSHPIPIADYQNSYVIDPYKTARDITDKVAAELNKRIAVMADLRWEELTERVEKIVQSDPLSFGIGEKERGITWFMARKDILGAIDFYKREKPEILEHLELKVQQYFSITELLNLTEGALNPLGKKKRESIKSLPLALYFVLGLPLFLLGFIIHILPFLLTDKLSKFVVKRSEFTGSVLLVLGLIFFSINAFGLSWLMMTWSNSWLLSFSFFFSLPFLGLFSFNYFIRLKRLNNNRRLKHIRLKKSRLIEDLNSQRIELLAQFKSAHEEYLKHIKANES